MNTKWKFRRLLSAVLAAAFFLLAGIPAGAEEITMETESQTETAETAATEVTEAPTEPETQPEETAVPAESTLPTQPEEADATVPSPTEETQAPTEETAPPTETTEPTQPKETVPPTEAETQPEATEASAETTEAVEESKTDLPEQETEAAQIPDICTIAEALALPSGTEHVTVQGTVVYVSANLAVLQDETGGMMTGFEEIPEIAPGDVLLATGSRSGGFLVTAFRKLGTEALPAVDATLAERPEQVRIHISNAILGEGVLEQNGVSLPFSAELPDTLVPGDRVEAWGVVLGSHFYADTVRPQPWKLYFGQLHAHTDLSDGEGTVEEAFAHASQVEGLDFFAVTDHSNSFDHSLSGTLETDGTAVSEEWKRGKEAAAGVTDETFVGIFGYEMTWGELSGYGHINTFHTPGWQTREQPEFQTLEAYYEALARVPGAISQFNHPGPAYGDFVGFSNHTPAYDAVMHLLEVGTENGATAYEYYTKALDKGWHLAPANNQNNHNGNWGDASEARTVVLAWELTEESLYEAMGDYRVYATEDRDLSVIYKLNGNIMGSILHTADALTVTAELHDPTDAAVGLVEVICSGGVTVASQTVGDPDAEVTMTVPEGYPYYYLRITQPDGDIAVTAPVWVDSYEDLGIRRFTAEEEKPVTGESVQLTLELYNQESVPFLVDSITFRQGDEVLYRVGNPGEVAPLGSYVCSFSHTWTTPGEITVQAAVTGTVAGERRSYEETLTLHCQSESVTACTIKKARAGKPGDAYRVEGYITAGNSNPYNTFPNTLYLQDDTGGIALVGDAPEGIQVGTPMEATGILRKQKGNLVLELTDWEFPDEAYYRYVPKTMKNASAMDYSAHGGELLQIEGEVLSLTKTADGKGIAKLTVKDILGDKATVLIEKEILSGAYGDNNLAEQIKKGRTIRVIGLLHMEEAGKPVLRVRNCDEVVYLPAKADTSNPKTGDPLFFFLRQILRIV